MKRILPLFLALAILVAGLWYWRATVSAPAPEADVRSADVVPAARFVNAEASEAYYREQIVRYPEVVKNYVALAQLQMQQARATGDEATYIPQARDLLEEALRRDANDYHALVLKGALLNKLHQFEDARALAETLIDQKPYHAFNYGTLVDALVELGDYERAVEVCDQMLALRPGLPSYARAAYLRELHGDTDGAVEGMKMAADAGVSGDEDRAWALYQLGMLFLSQNKPDTAAFLFEGLLEELPGYAPALAGLGHVALVRGELEEAVAQLEAAEARSSGVALELLAEAYQLTGDEAKLNTTYAAIQQSYLDARAMGEIVDMEYADFLADQDTMLGEVLALAEQQYQRRPGHLHALETYAWALYKNNRAADAIPYIEQAMRLGTGDAMVHFRAGMIYRAAGQAPQAAEQFEQALGAHLHVESPTAAREARATLAAL